jgi:hypothetical protein
VAIAEGNMLGKGPIVFVFSRSSIELICSQSAAGDRVFSELEVRELEALQAGSTP